jgi:hypothetical protein
MPGVLTEDVSAVYRNTADEARAKRATLEARLEPIEREREELREAIKKLDKLIAFIEGTGPFASKSKPKSKPPGAPSSERQDALAKWLQENMNGSDFIGPELLERADFNKALGMSSAYLSGALNALQARGVIRLVRTGHPERGARTKIWRVIDR